MAVTLDELVCYGSCHSKRIHRGRCGDIVRAYLAHSDTCPQFGLGWGIGSAYHQGTRAWRRPLRLRQFTTTHGGDDHLPHIANDLHPACRIHRHMVRDQQQHRS